jgi:hypothetical protein
MAHHDREIWFRRVWLWGSTAVHWKGAVVILVTCLVGGAAFWIGDATGAPLLGVLGFICALAWGFVMAERHMDRPL